MKTIQSPKAPLAIGPYSQAIYTHDTLYVSGQLPKDLTGDIQKQTHESLTHILAIVEEAGLKISEIVKCTVFMKDLSMFQTMNETYQAFFGEHKPARVTVEVKRLPKDALIEIDAIAVKT